MALVTCMLCILVTSWLHDKNRAEMIDNSMPNVMNAAVCCCAAAAVFLLQAFLPSNLPHLSLLVLYSTTPEHRSVHLRCR